MNQKIEKKGLTIRDLATIGIFSAILFALTMLIGAVTGTIPMLYFYSPTIIGLISGPIFMLIASKVHKTGAVWIPCLVVGALWGLMGGITVLACMVVFGGIGELIASRSKYKNFKLLSLAYSLYIFSFYLGAIAPVYYWVEWYVQSGGDGYADGYMPAIISAAHTPAAYLSIPVLFVGAFLGALFGRRILKKTLSKGWNHFMKLQIDPRVKLFQIILFGTMIFFLHTNIGTGIQIAVLAASLVVLGRLSCGIKLILYYVGINLLYALFSGLGYSSGIVGTLVIIAYVLRKMSPILGIYYLFTKAMTVGEFLNALNKLRVPQKVIIPLAVTLRFFPTIGQEVSIIRDALRLRGRPLTFLSFCRAPMEMLEYVLVPLMMRCIRIADELSASAIARGIENPKMHTAMYPLKFRPADAVYLTILISSSMALAVYEALL